MHGRFSRLEDEKCNIKDVLLFSHSIYVVSKFVYLRQPPILALYFPKEDLLLTGPMDHVVVGAPVETQTINQKPLA